MLEGHDDFATLVAAPKRIKYSGTLQEATEKDVLSQADYPQVRVIATAMRPHLQRTSNGSSLEILWQIEASSGERQFADLFAVEWAIYEAMASWRNYFTSLSMDASGYTVQCRAASVRTTLGDPGVDRGNYGWSSVWAGITEIWFATASLGT